VDRLRDKLLAILTTYQTDFFVADRSRCFAMFCVMLISWSSRTPRSRTTDKGLMTLAPSFTVCSMLANCMRRERLPNHASSVLSSLSCSRRDAHQLLMSVMQSYRRTGASSTPCSGRWRTLVCHWRRDGA